MSKDMATKSKGRKLFIAFFDWDEFGVTEFLCLKLNKTINLLSNTKNLLDPSGTFSKDCVICLLDWELLLKDLELLNESKLVTDPYLLTDWLFSVAQLDISPS